MAARPKTDEATETPERVFQLRAGDVTRVAVGSHPRVSIGAGERYTTSDPAVADQLAATPELEEVTAA